MQKKRVSDTRMASKIKPIEKGQQSAVRVSGCSAFSVQRIATFCHCAVPIVCVRACFVRKGSPTYAVARSRFGGRAKRERLNEGGREKGA